jgi:hypothetical protein
MSGLASIFLRCERVAKPHLKLGDVATPGAALSFAFIRNTANRHWVGNCALRKTFCAKLLAVLPSPQFTLVGVKAKQPGAVVFLLAHIPPLAGELFSIGRYQRINAAPPGASLRSTFDATTVCLMVRLRLPGPDLPVGDRARRSTLDRSQHISRRDRCDRRGDRNQRAPWSRGRQEGAAGCFGRPPAKPVPTERQRDREAVRQRRRNSAITTARISHGPSHGRCAGLRSRRARSFAACHSCGRSRSVRRSRNAAGSHCNSGGAHQGQCTAITACRPPRFEIRPNADRCWAKKGRELRAPPAR